MADKNKKIETEQMEALNAAIRRAIIAVVGRTACYDMHCLPDEEAARMSFSTMASDGRP